MIFTCLLLLITPAVATAASKPAGGIKIPATSDFFANYDGKLMGCSVNSKGVAVSGRRKGAYWIPTSFAEKAQSLKVKRAKGKKKATETAKLNLMKEIRVAKDAACDAVLNPPPTPPQEVTPTPTPTPLPVFFEERAALLSASDVHYMFRRLAYAPTAAQLAACTGQTAAFCYDNVIAPYNAAAHQTVMRTATDYLDENGTTANYYIPNPIPSPAVPYGVITVQGLQQAVAYVMHNSPNQYHAKLCFQTLQNRFAIEFSTLGAADINERVAWRYFELLCNSASDGRIRPTVINMVLDPSMQTFLDGINNTAASPNENLGREAFELYTVGQKLATDLQGPDLYSNTTDIPQIARAFTGWTTQSTFDPSVGRNELFSVFRLQNFDPAQKLVFIGSAHQTPMVTIWDALNAAMDHPAFYQHWARFLLQQYFVPSPSNEEVMAIAQTLEDTDNMHAAIRRIALSKPFFEEAVGQLERWHTEMLIGTSRTLAERGMPISISALQLGFVNGNEGPAQSPQGPFGWTTFSRANSGLRMAVVNDLTARLINQNTLFTAANWTFARVLDGMSTADKSNPAAVADHIAGLFNVTLTAGERAAIVEYMGRLALVVDGQTDEPTTFMLYPWDPNNASKVRIKIPGVILMVLGLARSAVK